MKKMTVLVGTLGSGLGALAGIIEMSIGTRILPWIGNKESPTILGAITFFLSVVAFLSVLAVSRNDKGSRNRDVAIFLGVFLPATICFTTVGRLWYLPGLLLVVTSFLLVYEYWSEQAKANSYKTARRKFEANQIIGVIGSLVILTSVVMAFYNSSFGLYQSEMMVDSKLIRFEVLPMDIARLNDLSGSMMKPEGIEVRLVMIIYILLILGAAIALISSLINSKIFTVGGGILAFAALAIFLFGLPAILVHAGVAHMGFQGGIESLTIGWCLSAVGVCLILLSNCTKRSVADDPIPKANQALPPDTMV